MKNAIELLSQLRYELTTDKKFKKITDSGSDSKLWNISLEELESQIGSENCTWFKSPWLFAECYVYRRIREAMLLCTTSLKDYDPYEKSKLESHELSLKSVLQLITNLCPLDLNSEKENESLMHERFRVIMEALLWANKNDLSLSSGNDVSSKVHNLIELLDSFRPNVLCDHTEELWQFMKNLKLQKESRSVCIDIVLDNCSIELAADLILCDFLLRNEFVHKIRLHGKAFSWFISDVTRSDFEILIQQLQSSNSLIINNFVRRIHQYMHEENKLELNCENSFWTLPYSFDQMERINPDLYSSFKTTSSLILFKGDLNYRKLIGDLNWDISTPLSEAVRGFKPTSVCAIRTLKSDLVANLDRNNANFIEMIKKNSDSNKWMITGDYGLIQFFSI